MFNLLIQIYRLLFNILINISQSLASSIISSKFTRAPNAAAILLIVESVRLNLPFSIFDICPFSKPNFSASSL